MRSWHRWCVPLHWTDPAQRRQAHIDPSLGLNTRSIIFKKAGASLDEGDSKGLVCSLGSALLSSAPISTLVNNPKYRVAFPPANARGGGVAEAGLWMQVDPIGASKRRILTAGSGRVHQPALSTTRLPAKVLDIYGRALWLHFTLLANQVFLAGRD
jgi:hypothetical protein